MRKIYTLFIALLLVGAFSAKAQFKFGIKAGVNLSKLTSTDPDAQFKNLTAWHGGLMAEFKMPIIGIEADALYTQNGAKYDYLGLVVGELKNTYIAIPVVAKFYILKVLNLHVGPQFSFLTSSKLGDLDVNDDFENSDLHVVFGAGFEMHRFHASIRYNLGVKDVAIAPDVDVKNNTVMISVGVWLKK